ncbi:MAG: hypothetical protein AAGA56_12730 [Myxococcota bacterium]
MSSPFTPEFKERFEPVLRALALTGGAVDPLRAPSSAEFAQLKREFGDALEKEMSEAYFIDLVQQSPEVAEWSVEQLGPLRARLNEGLATIERFVDAIPTDEAQTRAEQEIREQLLRFAEAFEEALDWVEHQHDRATGNSGNEGARPLADVKRDLGL